MKAKKIKNGFELSFKDDEERNMYYPYIKRKVDLSSAFYYLSLSFCLQRVKIK